MDTVGAFDAKTNFSALLARDGLATPGDNDLLATLDTRQKR